MSHIKKQRRDQINHSSIFECTYLSPDEVSYAIMTIVKQSLIFKEKSEINAYLGAVSKAEKELYRTIVIPHEKQQQHDNGDI